MELVLKTERRAYRCSEPEVTPEGVHWVARHRDIPSGNLSTCVVICPRVQGSSLTFIVSIFPRQQQAPETDQATKGHRRLIGFK
jgi:hypothetical protein